MIYISQYQIYTEHYSNKNYIHRKDSVILHSPVINKYSQFEPFSVSLTVSYITVIEFAFAAVSVDPGGDAND